MKKCLILSLFTLLALTLGAGEGFAQSRSNKIGIGVGALISNGLDGTVSLEHETKYHDSWEYFANAYLQWDDCERCGHICNESFWSNYNIYSAGIAYKPCIVRGRNNHGNLRIGLSGGGSTDDKLVGTLHVGYEHSYALKKEWTLYWQIKCDGSLNTRDNFKVGAAIGIKIPTKQR